MDSRGVGHLPSGAEGQGSGEKAGREGEPLPPAVPELKVANPFLRNLSPITYPGALGKQRTEEGLEGHGETDSRGLGLRECGGGLSPRPSQPPAADSSRFPTIQEGGGHPNSPPIPHRPCLGLAASTAPRAGQPEESYLFYLFAQIHTNLWGWGEGGGCYPQPSQC